MIAFYITNQDRFIAEAVQSAESVKQHHPSWETAIFVTDPLAESSGTETIFDYAFHIPTDETEPWYMRSIRITIAALKMLYSAGHRKALFLDCDTYICVPVPELEDALNYVDFVAAHAPGRDTCGLAKQGIRVPFLFPDMNIGVNPMRTTNIVRQLWIDVLNLYLEHPEWFGNNDQGPLRLILWDYVRSKSSFRFLIMPFEYNMRISMPYAPIFFAPKILHGHQPDVVDASRELAISERKMAIWHKGRLET